MTENAEKITLPIEIFHPPEPVWGYSLAVFWGLLASLIVAACIGDGFTKGFDKSSYMVVLSLPLWWFCYGGVKSARNQAYCTVSAEQVHARFRKILSWHEWTEPTASYQAVELSSESHNVGQGSASGSHKAMLIHPRNTSRNIPLKVWGWIAHSDPGETEQKEAAKEYIHQAMTILKLYATSDE